MIHVRPSDRRRWDWHVLAILLVALLLRVAIWWLLPYRDFVSDEAEYWGAAAWLAQGRGFSFFNSWIWTRPPVYVLFLAAHIKLLGPTALWFPRATQAVLSMLLVYLVIRLARRLSPTVIARSVALLAGWAMALSYSFATYAYLLLNETLFLVIFVAALLALLRWKAKNQEPRIKNRESRTRNLIIGYLIEQRWLVIAGWLFGLSALTKAIVLGWMPFVALWILVIGHRSRVTGFRLGKPRSWFPVFAAPALLTLAVCAVVLPWSAYATLRWSGGNGIILVDTTGGYNFALAAQTAAGGRDENKLHDQICDTHSGVCSPEQSQGKRQQLAYEIGRGLISAYPLQFIAKTGNELLDMVQLRYGGAERFTSGFVYGKVPLPHLIGLLWDDTLYILSAPLAVVGLIRRQGRSGKGLIVSWLLYNIGVGAILFAINRFRQPLLPFVFIYAACALVQWREAWIRPGQRRTAQALAIGLLLVIAPSYIYWPFDPNRRATWQETLNGVQGLRDAATCRTIEAVLHMGDVGRARQLHDAADQQARQRFPLGLPCLALINARLLEREGRIEGEDGALAHLAKSKPFDQGQAARVLMAEGDLLRRVGRFDCVQNISENILGGACSRFVTRDVDIENDLAWAWRELQPPPTTTINVGQGLDIGYIDGFYSREYPEHLSGQDQIAQGFRWSGPQSWLRFPAAGTGAPQTLNLMLNGFNGYGQITRITPRINGQILDSIELSPRWHTITIALPPTPAGADVVIALNSSVFVPDANDLAQRVRSQARQPLRLLGFQLRQAQLTPASPAAGQP